jgi:energy-coupling factor transporter ATP-binding protein EcfA2
MSDESNINSPAGAAAPSPADTQKAAMKVMKDLATGTVAPPRNLQEAKAMVAAEIESKTPVKPNETAPPAAFPSSGSSSVQPAAGPPPISPTTPEETPSVQKLRRVTGRLAKIEIENYRVFRGRFELTLEDGCNLLAYGENGAGKSSLYHALQDFFENPERFIKLEDNRHSFNTTPAAITLSFITPSSKDGHTLIVKPYEWSAAKNDSRAPEIRSLDKGKGFLDYKSLLRVHLLPVGQEEINLFDIFINPLLAQYKNPVGSRGLTFGEEWRSISAAFKPRVWMPGNLDNWIKEFNAGFERVVKDTFESASKLLNELDSELAVEIEFHAATYDWHPKDLKPPKILAMPSFRKLQRRDYSKFLNEARLTSLAIALYLAGLKISPVKGYRLLVLDDILIGLDMMNRVKMLDLIHEHFSEWQIFLFTYSKAWFERLKDRLKPEGWAAPWKAIVLREDQREEETSPRVVIEESGDRLQMAAIHLRKKDYHGAAVYARSALEGICHEACAKGAIYIPHVTSIKDRKLEHFLDVLDVKLGELVDLARRKIALRLVALIREAKTFVLNRNAHFDVEEEDVLSGEVGAAIAAVKEFAEFLGSQHWAKANFVSGRRLTAEERLSASLAASRQAAALGALRQALGSLSEANEAFWEINGSRLRVLFPVGETPRAQDIWKAAKDQGLLAADVDARLNPLRPYLFATQKPKDFAVSKFAAAASALEELAAPPPPQS